MSNPSAPMGAHVEIVEPYTAHGLSAGELDHLPCIKPTIVRVNGTDVGLIKKDGLHIGVFGSDQAATVTLTLLVKSVSIKAE